MVVIGGSQSVVAAGLGAVLLTVVSEYFRAFQDWSLVFFGLSLVLVMIFAPRGLFVEAAALAKNLFHKVVSRRAAA
jgi:branched-chain amino acid transport system permease protein